MSGWLFLIPLFFILVVLNFNRAIRRHMTDVQDMIDSTYAEDSRAFKRGIKRGNPGTAIAKYSFSRPAEIIGRYLLGGTYSKRHLIRLIFFMDPWKIYPAWLSYRVRKYQGKVKYRKDTHVLWRKLLKSPNRQRYIREQLRYVMIGQGGIPPFHADTVASLIRQLTKEGKNTYISAGTYDLDGRPKRNAGVSHY